MPSSEYEYSPHTRNVLVESDRKIRQQYLGEPHRAMYDYWRISMSKICPVDAFYLGFFQPNHRIAYVYSFDGDEFTPPDVHSYGPNGMAAHLRSTRRPYRFSDDAGHLLNRGVSFGDVSRRSADAVCIPLFREGGQGSQIAGVASMQSYTPRCYTDEHVHAFELLGRSVMTVFRREDEDEETARELGRTPGLRRTTPVTVAEALDTVSFRLAKLRDRIVAASSQIPEEAAGAREAFSGIVTEFEDAQTLVMDVLRRPSPDADHLLARLTPRERDVALLVADGLGNQTVSSRLHISVRTVESHIANIKEKLEIEKRDGIVAALRPLL